MKPEQDIPPHRILVVDDEPYLRQLNADALLRSGYHVDTAADGAVAWDILQRQSYDLLVTDNRMPKVSGIELLEKLTDSRVFLPVIMATAALPREAFAKHPELQPAAVLLKPYTIQELLETVKEVLRAAKNVNGKSEPPSKPSADGLS